MQSNSTGHLCTPLALQDPVACSEAIVSRKSRAWYWIANDGKVYINLRYGTRILELAKGKSAIEVGEMKQLVPLIEALKQAVAAGE